MTVHLRNPSRLYINGTIICNNNNIVLPLKIMRIILRITQIRSDAVIFLCCLIASIVIDRGNNKNKKIRMQVQQSPIVINKALFLR